MLPQNSEQKTLQPGQLVNLLTCQLINWLTGQPYQFYQLFTKAEQHISPSAP